MVLAEKGRTVVRASFDRVGRVDPEPSAERRERLTELVDARRPVVETAALEETIGEWSPSAFTRERSSPSGMIPASEAGLSLSRATPMPPSQTSGSSPPRRTLRWCNPGGEAVSRHTASSSVRRAIGVPPTRFRQRDEEDPSGDTSRLQRWETSRSR